MSPLLEWAAAITLVLGCLTGIGVLLKRVWLGVRKAVHVVDLVQKQLTPNGGGSVFDMSKRSAEEAVRAREKAEQVEAALADYRQHQAEDAAEKRVAMGKLQHDLTNVRAGQEMLLEQQVATDERVTKHRDRNTEHVLELRRAVADLSRATAARDEALGTALRESLDVAIAVNEADASAKEQAVADAMRERLDVTLLVDEAEQET